MFRYYRSRYPINKTGEIRSQNNALKLFNSYLDGRSQIVRIGCASSDERPITTGVSQGSVLGPLLCLVYMNDFPTCLRHTTGNQFADDTITYAQGDTAVDLQGLMQVDVDNISAWLKLNKLTLNISKSGTMLV